MKNVEAEDRGRREPMAADAERPCRPSGLGVRSEPRQSGRPAGDRKVSSELSQQQIPTEAQL